MQDFYRKALSKHGLTSAAALSYNSRESQIARFKVLLKLIPDKRQKYTLLDAGCGLGDLISYLRLKEFRNIDYNGIDVVPEMITGAQKKFPGYNFRCLDFLQDNFQEKYDLVVASGSLNIIFDRPDNQKEYIQKAVCRLFETARLGCAFNLLSIAVQDQFVKDERFYYSDPLEMLIFCKQLTKNCRLIQNYLPHDYTIIMRKSEKKFFFL